MPLTADGLSMNRWIGCDGCGRATNQKRLQGWRQFRHIGILMCNLCPDCYSDCQQDEGVLAAASDDELARAVKEWLLRRGTKRGGTDG